MNFESIHATSLDSVREGANLPISREQPASRESLKLGPDSRTPPLPLSLFTNRQAIPNAAIVRTGTIHRLQNVTVTAWCWARGLASWEKLPVWCWAITSENGESSSRWSCKLALGWGSCSSASSTGRQSGKLYIYIYRLYFLLQNGNIRRITRWNVVMEYWMVFSRWDFNFNLMELLGRGGKGDFCLGQNWFDAFDRTNVSKKFRFIRSRISMKI